MAAKSATTTVMDYVFQIRMQRELGQLIASESTKDGLPGGMNELVVQILAKHFKRPDLAKVPRKKMGRPSKLATAS